MRTFLTIASVMIMALAFMVAPALAAQGYIDDWAFGWNIAYNSSPYQYQEFGCAAFFYPSFANAECFIEAMTEFCAVPLAYGLEETWQGCLDGSVSWYFGI